MARLECTVAHMGFPAATLNKRIKNQAHTMKSSSTRHQFLPQDYKPFFKSFVSRF
jgi:hypothetical protein